jgi:hypothetical protein
MLRDVSDRCSQFMQLKLRKSTEAPDDIEGFHATTTAAGDRRSSGVWNERLEGC